MLDTILLCAFVVLGILVGQLIFNWLKANVLR